LERQLDLTKFQRIQVNGVLTDEEVEVLCGLYPRQTVITQHNPSNASLLAVSASNHALLIDASGGRGASPDRWEDVSTSKHVGFAGGLGPDNIASELGRIQGIARNGWWVDMEGKLRIDDWFSVERAAECIGMFRSHSLAALSAG
jgi:phosphoribosylanthranilate isomerase